MLKNLMPGFEIFLKYKPDMWLAAEHDIIYGPFVDDCSFTDEEKKILEEGGWFVDTECDSWAAFV
jgi:hypothetical protein